jgi:hypothetical protein
MTQKQLVDIYNKLAHKSDNGEFDLWDNDYTACLLNYINQHVAEVIGEDERIKIDDPQATMKANRIGLRAEQRKRAGLKDN